MSGITEPFLSPFLGHESKRNGVESSWNFAQWAGSPHIKPHGSSPKTWHVHDMSMTCATWKAWTSHAMPCSMPCSTAIPDRPHAIEPGQCSGSVGLTCLRHVMRVMMLLGFNLWMLWQLWYNYSICMYVYIYIYIIYYIIYIDTRSYTRLGSCAGSTWFGEVAKTLAICSDFGFGV
jgi:hypothetical protein